MSGNRVDIVSNGKAVGSYDLATGNVFAAFGQTDEPAVLVIGKPDGDTGQLKVRQPQGNYLRICRWDRISEDTAAHSQATLRTLPQCGCGGSLGIPQLFDTFQDMSEYYFRAFYLKDAER